VNSRHAFVSSSVPDTAAPFAKGTAGSATILARRVLIVDDDEDFSASLRDLLQVRGYEISTAADPDQAWKVLDEIDPLVAMIDIRLGLVSGVDLLAQVVERKPKLVCVMITAHADVETAIAAMRLGAYDYYEKASGPGELYTTLDRCFEKHQLSEERSRAREELARTEVFLKKVIENVPTAIVVKEARDRCHVLANRAAEKFYGIPCDQIIGRKPHEIFSENEADIIASSDDLMLQSGGQLSFDERMIETPGNGARLAAAQHLAIFGEDGEPQYLLAVIEDVTERRRAEERVAYLARHDTLTDLPNRVALTDHLSIVLNRAVERRERFAVLSIDLDHFKEINDVFGHVIGDALLREVSRRLQAAAERAFVARLGGDEFIVVAVGGDQPSAAEAMAEQLVVAVIDDIEVEGHRLKASLSVGIAVYPQDGSEARSLLSNADAALYRAKADGRGSIRFFEPEMDKQLRERRALQHDLRSAIERRQLVLHYQPQGLITGEITGFEALVRWPHPTRGLVSPGTFIPLAEQTGLIVPIGEWVLREACREAASWPRALQISVNLSPVQFRHSDLPGLVHSILLDTGLAPNRLELEITESVLIDDFSRAVSVLRRLKSLGTRIAMDDFGTGYSSLSYLQAFPFDKIKIDQSFISDVERNMQSAAIVRAVISLGRSLGLPVLAEGVETKEQLSFLWDESCDEMQGYLLGHPKPMEHYAHVVGSPATPKPRITLAS
jgi:diguanylate cyclase (GGDEF)-like protein/PAS domain S-box-containing protein